MIKYRSEFKLYALSDDLSQFYMSLELASGQKELLLLLFSQLEMPTFSLLGCGGQLPVGKQGERSDVPRGG